MFLKQTNTIIKKNFKVLFSDKKQLFKNLLYPIITSLFIAYTSNINIFLYIIQSYYFIFLPQFFFLNEFYLVIFFLIEHANKDLKTFIFAILPIYLPSSVSAFTKRLLVNFVNEKKEKFKET